MATNTRKYYVYYDKKTGAILSATNEKSSVFEHGIEVEFADVEGLLTGTQEFKDYVIGHKRLSDNTTVLAIIPVGNEGYTFKNNVFEWISENPHAECIVEWNGPLKTWNVSLTDAVKNTYKDYILTSKLVFFVTLESDLDFLVRTIYIDLQQLLDSNCIKIPFTTSLEHKIDKISISSKLVFKSYGLKVIHE
jgi:hypothetical protein